jgi:Glyoxalase-like domain
MQVGDLRLETVVINVQDRRRAVDFWTATLGYVRREGEWDPQFMMLVDPARRRLPISLQLTDSGPKEPVRVHLDLYTREQAPRSVPSRGLTRVEVWIYPRRHGVSSRP